MKITRKKIFWLSALVLFSVIVVPNDVFAQSLGFNGGTYNAVVNQPFSIDVVTSDAKPGVVLNLQALDEQLTGFVNWVNITPRPCTTGTNGICSFSVTATQAGRFKLTATDASGTYQGTTSSSVIIASNPGKNLILTNNPSSIRPGENSVITVATSDGVATTVNFQILNTRPGFSLSQPNCVTAGNATSSCNTTFKSTLFNFFGQVQIQASATGYDNPAPVTITLSPFCTIQSATFTPSGTQASNWYQKGSVWPPVKITVVGNNCAGVTVGVSLMEEDKVPLDTMDNPTPPLDNRQVAFLSNNTLFIDLEAGDAECDSGIVGNDCNYYIMVQPPGGTTFRSKNQPGGELVYDCGNACKPQDNWKLIGINGSLVSAPNSPVPQKDTNTYKPLAPLPNPNSQGGMMSTVNVGGGGAGLASYLNLIIRLVIGIAAVLAVIMIVWGGIEYMSSELIGNKEAGKDRISHAVLGLLLALGAWVILSTINPKLLYVSKLVPTTVIQGVDAPQTAANGRYCGGAYANDQPWDVALAGALATLPSGVNPSPSGDCSKVGQQSCTSIKGFKPDIVAAIKAQGACPNCEVVVTGGTECWLHNATSSHKPGSATVDLRGSSDTPNLNKFITKSNNPAFPSSRAQYVVTVGGVTMTFLAEQPGQTARTTAGHWHVELGGARVP